MGLVFILLWPLMGIAAFMLAFIWNLFQRSPRMTIKRFGVIWLAIAFGLSALCAFLDATGLFILPGANWPDLLYYGPAIIWPLPIAILSGRLVASLCRAGARWIRPSVK